MVFYPLRMKGHTYVLAFQQINEMKEMSMGKYLNMIIDEYVLNKAKEKGNNNEFRTLEERCFICGKRANWKGTFYGSVFLCGVHWILFKNKYTSYVSSFKELKER